MGVERRVRRFSRDQPLRAGARDAAAAERPRINGAHTRTAGALGARLRGEHGLRSHAASPAAGAVGEGVAPSSIATSWDIICSTAGPRVTSSIAGKIKKKTGKTNFTATLRAASSALLPN